MPGRIALTHPISAVAARLGGAPGALADEPPRPNIAPGQQIVTFDAQGLGHMRWGIIPVGRKNARGRPVMETIVNARSETLFDKTAFDGVGRAVVPITGWYEWTGERGRKTPWEITASGGGLLFLAAITDTWHAPGGAAVRQVATVTCPPNGDLVDIHNRMGVILAAQEMSGWLHGAPAEAANLMRPWPDGLLRIQPAEPSRFA